MEKEDKKRKKPDEEKDPLHVRGDGKSHIIQTLHLNSIVIVSVILTRTVTSPVFFITRGTYRRIYERGMKRVRMKENVLVGGLAAEQRGHVPCQPLTRLSLNNSLPSPCTIPSKVTLKRAARVPA